LNLSRLRALLVVLAITLPGFAAGCSDDDGAGDPSTQTPEPGAEASEPVTPPDDATLEPPHPCAAELGRTTTTDFYEAARCLFEGPDPPQKGVANDAIEPKRVAILRGRVTGPDGKGLADVKVTVPGHGAFGHTLTMPNGTFALAANGGGPVTLRFDKAGSLSAQRHVTTEWRSFAVYPEVTLLPETAQAAMVDVNAPGGALVSGPESNDASGKRRSSIFVRPGTKATLALPDGSKKALPTFHLRMTEYTVGDRGPSAMPGDLPATSAYTYATDFTIDEARAAGAEHVAFDPPVVNYVDNFLKFPAGTRVPSGHYDAARDAWTASDGVGRRARHQDPVDERRRRGARRRRRRRRGVRRSARGTGRDARGAPGAREDVGRRYVALAGPARAFFGVGSQLAVRPPGRRAVP
jgi:hypothetical protein